MRVQLFGVNDFLAMLARGAGRTAMDERDAMRTQIYDANLAQAAANGVDENFCHLYAQLALREFDQRNIQ